MAGSRTISVAATILAIAACAPAPLAPQKREGKPKEGKYMDPYIPLYQFTRAANPISIARIAKVSASPGPRPGEETVEIGVEIKEPLWREGGANSRTYQLKRPQSRAAQIKFPDPVWGRVSLEEGAQILIVSPNTTQAGGRDPIYADQISDPQDPVLLAIRSVLKTQRTTLDRGELFRKRLEQLKVGTVEKLFAVEALANDGPFRPEEEAQIGAALPRAFAEEKDDYVKISLGSALWDRIYPRTDAAGRANTLNATIQAAASATELVRTFALDRLAETDPIVLRESGVKGTPELIRLLEERRAQETDVDVRRQLDGIIAALRK